MDRSDPRWRLPGVALLAWAGGLAGARWWGAAVALAGVVCLVAVASVGWRRARLPVVVGLVVAATVCGGALLREVSQQSSPLQELAEQRARGTVRVEISADPRRLDEHRQVIGVTVVAFAGDGIGFSTRTRGVLWAPTSWPPVALGETWQLTARLGHGGSGAMDGAEVALSPLGSPRRVQRADLGWRAAAVLRAGVRTAAGVDGDQLSDSASLRDAGVALVPALVDGDDASLPEVVTEDFRTSGLTHLLAVSGTNLTILLAFVLMGARGIGVRGRWLVVLGLAAVIGFVLLARGEPSVLRAAVMGSIGVLALGQRDPRRGLGMLSASVLVLLLVAPSMAVQAGFALSVAATAGILLLVPLWQQALAESLTHRPGARWWAWLPVAVLVPLAAQVACTPLVAALSGQVSLVAVAANLAAAPAVGPVTVLGLVGGAVAVVWEAAGRVVAWPAGWGGTWIVLVATRAADLPGAAWQVDTSVVALVLVSVSCAVCLWAVPRLLARPRWLAVCVVLGGLVVVVPLPQIGWPPAGWLVAACDVGQGDALLLNAGGGQAVMVDVGPEPRAAARCLRRFEVDRVPLLVLSHFDADHVAGLAGVVEAVDRVETAAVGMPPDGAALVREVTRGKARVAVTGTRQIGQVRLQVLSVPSRSANPNDASVVLLAQVGGARVLLTGDLGRDAQRSVRRLIGPLQVDVVKIAHHGSKDTDLDWLHELAPEVALVSVGADNTYGHPAPEVLAALAGVLVGRTDEHGDLVVVADGEHWEVLVSGASGGVRGM